MRELMPNSEVARLEGKKPHTRLATLATFSPQGRGLLLTRFGRVPEAMRENTKTRGNKARMSMKTNDKYKKLLSRTVPDQTPTAHPRAGGRKAAADSSTSRPLNLSITESREQSENVYENKGQVQKVAESYSARPNVGVRHRRQRFQICRSSGAAHRSLVPAPKGYHSRA